MPVTHAKVATIPDDPNYEVGSDEWNAAHAVSIVNADISASAAIDAAKIGAGDVSNTEFGYLDGVTSAIQTQLDSKQASGSYVTTSRSISTTAPLTGGGDLSSNRTLAIPKATASVDGYLAQADFSTFNAKADATLMPAYARVTGSDFTTSSTSLVNVTGLSAALAANTTYEFEAWLSANSTDTNGIQYAMQYSVAGATIEAGVIGTFSGTAVRTDRLTAFNTATGNRYIQVNADGEAIIKGIVTTGANAGNLTVQNSKATSGTSTIRINSFLKVIKVA